MKEYLSELIEIAKPSLNQFMENVMKHWRNNNDKVDSIFYDSISIVYIEILSKITNYLWFQKNYN